MPDEWCATPQPTGCRVGSTRIFIFRLPQLSREAVEERLHHCKVLAGTHAFKKAEKGEEPGGGG